jgi:hypothetical protein
MPVTKSIVAVSSAPSTIVWRIAAHGSSTAPSCPESTRRCIASGSWSERLRPMNVARFVS